MLTYVAVTVVVLFLSRFLWRRWKYDLHKVPSPPSLPFLGHTLDVYYGNPFKQRVLYIGSKLKLLGYPKLMRMHIMGRTVIYITDVNFIKNNLMSKTAPFPRSTISASKVLSPLLGNHPDAKSLFQMSGISPYARAVRKIYATIMQSPSLKKAIPEIVSHIDFAIRIIDRARKNGPVELSQLFTKLTLDVIGALAFETNMGGLDGSRDIHRLFGEVKEVTLHKLQYPLTVLSYRLFPRSSEAQRRQNKIQSLANEYEKLVQFFQQREDPSDGEEPMWYALKTMIDPETGKPISFETFVAEVGFAVFAGMETTGLQLGWILMLLASYPRVTNKLREEFKKHGLHGSVDDELSFDGLSNLSYLTAVIKEGMRIAYVSSGPPTRYVPEDMNILGYRIPKGTTIAMLGTRAMNTKEDWGDPEVFRPERWLTGEDMSDKYNFPFSVGPRDCIGQRLSILEMRLVIVKLLTLYDFQIDDDWRELLNNAKSGIMIEPKDGLWFHVTPKTMTVKT